MNIDQIAEIAYESNRIYAGFHDTVKRKHWAELSIEEKDNTYEAVQLILDNPDITDIQCHEHWLSMRIAEGWKYGPRDMDNKYHPCLVDFNHLTQVQRYQRTMFREVVLRNSKL